MLNKKFVMADDNDDSYEEYEILLFDMFSFFFFIMIQRQLLAFGSRALLKKIII